MPVGNDEPKNPDQKTKKPKTKKKRSFFKNPSVVKSIVLRVEINSNVSAKNKLVRSYFDGLF